MSNKQDASYMREAVQKTHHENEMSRKDAKIAIERARMAQEQGRKPNPYALIVTSDFQLSMGVSNARSLVTEVKRFNDGESNWVADRIKERLFRIGSERLLTLFNNLMEEE